MLVVRSNDKEILIVDNLAYMIEKPNKMFLINCYVNDNFVPYIAEYSTKEKALKALDMFEAFINEDYEKLHNLGYKQCIVDRQVYGVKHYKLTSLSFQFPQDNEVK